MWKFAFVCLSLATCAEPASACMSSASIQHILLEDIPDTPHDSELVAFVTVTEDSQFIPTDMDITHIARLREKGIPTNVGAFLEVMDSETHPHLVGHQVYIEYLSTSCGPKRMTAGESGYVLGTVSESVDVRAAAFVDARQWPRSALTSAD